MRILAAEAVHLVLDARTVAGPHTIDAAREHRALGEGGAHDVVGPRVGLGDPAGDLSRVPASIAEESENGNVVASNPVAYAVSRLLDQPAVVDGAAVEAGRRAGLQPTLRQLEFLQAR